MTVSDAACELSIDEPSLLQLVADGRIKRYADHVGGRFLRSEVDKLQEELDPWEAESAELGKTAARGGPYAGPRDRSSEWYLYVVEIIDVGCKVGITRDPLSRLRTHGQQAAAFDRATGRVLLSWPHKNAVANEARLVGDRTNEYLREGFDPVADKVVALPMIRSCDRLSPAPVVYKSIASMKAMFTMHPDATLPAEENGYALEASAADIELSSVVSFLESYKSNAVSETIRRVIGPVVAALVAKQHRCADFYEQERLWGE